VITYFGARLASDIGVAEGTNRGWMEIISAKGDNIPWLNRDIGL
jgi:hypothetical protein